MTLPKVVSLFSGAGGLDLGFRNAGFPLAFAVDNSQWAIRTHKRNFPDTKSITADLIEMKPSGVLAQLSDVLEDGDPIGVIGGPPCQGFSRSNPNALASDPRNKLPLLYLEIVEALQSQYDVQFVLFENVMGIRDVKHEVAFKGILSRFRELGYYGGATDYCALDFGVPQVRRRVIISAFSSSCAFTSFSPVVVHHEDLTVRAAIGDLPDPAYFSPDLTPEDTPHHPNHWTMRPVSKRFSDPDNTMAGARSFRRLSWDKPSPTVAYGHREIHVHPSGKRRLSIYEAMVLQGFPHGFVLEGPLSAQVDQISNAVPPPLAQALAEATKSSLTKAAQSPGSCNELVA